MQTTKENSRNNLVFEYGTKAWVNPPTGSKTNFILAYETLANDSGSGTFATASLEFNNRWYTTPITFVSESTSDKGKLFVRAGTTYEIELRYGLTPYYIWGEAQDKFGQAKGTWVEPYSATSDNSIVLKEDRMFVSGTVEPGQKLYITANEDAEMVIYHE